MRPDICIVTPTDGRPECFALLERWVREQSFVGRVFWVVATGNDIGYTYGPLPPNIERAVLKVGLDGRNRLAANLSVAMEYLESQKIDCPVVFMEDDDYYHPDYLTYYAIRMSEGAPIVGEGRARYYHVGQRRFRQLENRGHASLAQTAIHADLIPLVRDVAADHFDVRMPAIDMKLWKRAPWPRHLHEPIGVHVSVKGMPGTTGYGIGHREDMGEADPWMQVFRQWGLPLDYALYMNPPIRFAKPAPAFGEPGGSLVAIGMVMRDHGAMTRRALESVLATTAHLEPQVMLWDNASTEPAALALLDEMESRGVAVFRATEGAGWIRPINHMARVSTAPHFVGLNNDVVCHPGWCDALLAPFAEDLDIWETGPTPQCGFLAPNFHGRPGRGEPDYIEGWCFCVPRGAVEQFGPYDEHHLKGFYGEDSDLSLRLKAAGHKIAVAPGCRVDHLGSATLKVVPDRPEIAAQEERNLSVLRERWRDYPAPKATS